MSLVRWSRQLFEGRRLRLAVQRYAPVLRHHLARSYGAAEHYTPEQVQAALARARVPARHHRLMYAAFLPEAAFSGAGIPGGAGSYDTLHRAFLQHEPLAMTRIAGDALPIVEMIGGLGSTEGDSGGHH
jgi:hypothetical protein